MRYAWLQVTERILRDLETGFKIMLREGEEKLTKTLEHNEAKTEMLEAQLETSRMREAELGATISQLKEQLAQKSE